MTNNGSSKEIRELLRELGRRAEDRVLEGLQTAGITARHATEVEDISGWDLEITFRGITVHVDITISKTRFEQKMASDQCKSGLVIPVLIDPTVSTEELAKETLRQVLGSLNGSLILDLLRG